ncbi:MAG: manganese efflux pump [Planctomycetes bacterium]|nr:manganese efflux pump [Planctomycetota bacterium]
MDLPHILAIAVALGMDALAVSIAAGAAIKRVTHRHIFRIAFHFGLFQFMMPVLGWLAGSTVSKYIEAFDHWIAFALLFIIGGKMLWDANAGILRSGGRHNGGGPGIAHLRPGCDPTRGWMLIMLSIATSIDALAVGLSMAFLNVSIWLPSVIIGIIAGVLTVVGIRFGSRLGSKYGRWADTLGGIVLIAIGVRILVSHLCAG